MPQERKRISGLKVKDSLDKAGDDIVNAFSKLGENLKSIGDKTKEVLMPTEIAVKIEETWDKAIVQRTKRTIEFFEESGQKVSEQHRLRVEKAQEGAKRWKVVFAKPLHDIGAAFPYRPPTFPKSDQDNALIETALKDNFVFAHVSSKLLPGLIAAFEPVMIHKGTEIIQEGDVGDYFYVIGSGVVAFQVDGKHVGDARAGQTFGELALLYQAPRAATCVAKSMCGLFRLDQETFRRILAQQCVDANREVIDILKKVPYFKDLDDEYLNKIVNNLKITRFNEGDILLKKGDVGTKFAIVKEGRVKATDIKAGGSEYKELEFGPGEFFGETTIVERHAAVATVVAMTSGVALMIGKDIFEKVMGKDVRSLIRKTIDKKKLVRCP
jgi:cAMP-dependent protein kinase regulator